MSETANEIAAAEDWLVATCTELVGSVFKSIESGPGDWSEAYLKRVIEAAPAIRVVWEGGPVQQKPAQILTLTTQWTVYIVTGALHGTKDARQRRMDAQAAAYRACKLLAPVLHWAVIPGAGQIHVTGIGNLWSSELDKYGLAVYGIGLEIPISIDPDIDEDGYDDFLTAGIDWDLPGVGQATDAQDTVTLPGPEQQQ